MNLKSRDYTIDNIKGILIILVIVGHSIQYASGMDYLRNDLFYDNPLFLLIYSFHMPLFALISGYFFAMSNKRKLAEVVKRKCMGIFVPLAFFCFLILLNKVRNDISMVSHPFLIVNEYLRSLVGWPLWFLATVFFDSLIIACLSRFTKNQRIKELLMWLVFICSLFVPDTFILSIHKFIYPFFLIGYLLATYNFNLCKQIRSGKGGKLEIIFLSVVSFLLLWSFDRNCLVYVSGFCIVEHIEVLWYDLYRMLVGFAVSRWVCLVLPLLTKQREIKWLSRIGKDTLGIYCFQTLTFTFVPSVISQIGVFAPSWLIQIEVAVFILALSYLLTLISKRNVPWVVGKL